MNEDFKTVAVLSGLAVVFLVLSLAFRLNVWGRTEPVHVWPPVDPAFTNTASVRQSVAQILQAGGDPSDYDCYVCHEKDKPPTLKFSTNNIIILPDEHSDLVMRHGRHNRNDNCYNCHDPQNLNKLKTRSGQIISFQESTLLCASCHGPIYRDWEIGVHGRMSGYWNPESGPVTRLGCTSCHSPHAPKFQSLAPAPRPHRLHPSVQRLTQEETH
jgi:uncharacterized CHY-type Zn-finger protein